MNADFASRLTERIKLLRNPSVMGLDPQLAYLPPECMKNSGIRSMEDAAAAILGFNRALLTACRDIIPAVKFQMACYEQFGAAGWDCLYQSVQFAKEMGYLSICDGKRNDIGSTAETYARAILGKTELASGCVRAALNADAVTINPYLGSDGVEPFLAYCREEGKGVFILLRTSNPSSVEIQNLELKDGRRLYEAIADLISAWSETVPHTGDYSPVGAVVGATWPEEARALRKRLPNQYFLIPGYGAQGGKAEAAVAGFDHLHGGGIVNASRSLMLAWKKEAYRGLSFAEATKEEAIEMRDLLQKALQNA